MMVDFWEKVREEITCSICQEIYEEQVTISCFHSFCRKCLERHARIQTRGGAKSFSCPLCYAQIDLPDGNRFDSLPCTPFHRCLLTVFQNYNAIRGKGSDEGNITCAYCTKESSPMWYYCFYCKKFMCQHCQNAHEISKDAFEGHCIICFQGDNTKPILQKQSFCLEQYHQREITRYFCLSCESCICHICTVTDHLGHEIVLIDKAAEIEKKRIEADTTLAREMLIAFMHTIQQFSETSLKLERNIKIAKTEVTQVAEKVIAKIREPEDETMELLQTRSKEAGIRGYQLGVIAYLEIILMTRLGKINAAKKKVKSLIEQAIRTVEYALSLVWYGSNSYIMQKRESWNKRFKELCETEIPKHHQTSFIKFTATACEDGLKLGYITTEEIDVNHTTLEGLSQTFEAGVEAELILCQKTSEGHTVKQPDLKSQVELLIEPANKVADVTISNKEDGKLEIKFTPNVPGTYSIDVKICGERLPICPVSVQVKEPELASMSWI